MFSNTAECSVNGTIVGTVTDPSGAVVAGAEVRVTHTGTGQSRQYTTNSAGAYQAPQLQIGNYTVEVTNSGFKKYEQTGIVLNVNDTVRVDASLQVGQATESVTVAAEAVQVQSDSSEQSDLISGKQVTQLAINGRNITSRATLGTGASTNSADSGYPPHFSGTGISASMVSETITICGSLTAVKIIIAAAVVASQHCLPLMRLRNLRR